MCSSYGPMKNVYASVQGMGQGTMLMPSVPDMEQCVPVMVRF